MRQSLIFARSLYKAIKEIEAAHIAASTIEPGELRAHMDEKVEDAEDYLAQLLEAVKQWTVEQ